MIFGIGTDIVQVSRVASLFDHYGERFPQRILTDTELKEFLASKWPAHFLAKHFAAKEAAAKALGTGLGQGVQFRHIGVAHMERGQPILEWKGRASELIQAYGISHALLSLADEKEYALAFVTLIVTEANPPLP